MDSTPTHTTEQKDLIQIKEEKSENKVDVLVKSGGGGGGGVGGDNDKSGDKSDKSAVGSFADSATASSRLLCLHGRVG